MKWYYSRILRKIFKFNDWEVAIRKKTTNDFLDINSECDFIPIPNTREYWFADPILFEYDGNTWLFVEAYNKRRGRGELGVFQINEGCKPTDYKTILTADYHMSYPFVFTYKNKVFMIPESGADKKIHLYQATQFPYNWQYVGVLCEGKAFRDSTVYTVDGTLYLLTYERTDNRRLFHTYDCHEYKLDIENCCSELISTYNDKKAFYRPAGLMVETSDRLVRSSQKCKNIYGESLIIWELPTGEQSWKHAKKAKEITGESLKIIGRKAVLTHTYSCTSKYEVVDYRTMK